MTFIMEILSCLPQRCECLTHSSTHSQCVRLSHTLPVNLSSQMSYHDQTLVVSCLCSLRGNGLSSWLWAMSIFTSRCLTVEPISSSTGRVSVASLSPIGSRRSLARSHSLSRSLSFSFCFIHGLLLLPTRSTSFSRSLILSLSLLLYVLF